MTITRNRLGAGSDELRFRFAAMAAAVVMLITGSIVVSTNRAYADDYPTWDDVAAVRNDLASSQAKVAQLTDLIAQLQRRVEESIAAAAAAGDVWQRAESAYQAGYERTKALQLQADEANAKAEISSTQAGQMAAQLARGGSQDLTAVLFANPGDSDDLLYNLGMSSKVSAQAHSVYSRALQERNTAQSLSDAAAVAEAELKILNEKSKAAYEAAQAASAEAVAAHEAQKANLPTLQQQVAFLEGQASLVEAQYNAGVAARAAEAARQAELARQAEAARQAELARLAEEAGIGSGSWVKPSAGYITSSYGWRVNPSGFHKGTDLGAGCGGNIYAASYGRVTMAIYGYNGGYGNMIEITHPDGTATRYGHIQPGGILVSYGQQVSVGDHIAEAGNTGLSFGCHLHFETWDGGFVNPVGFMWDRGVSLG
jgi:murein DD-endopeptidase MepM/ murein hydrolase activator NlpD